MGDYSKAWVSFRLRGNVEKASKPRNVPIVFVEWVSNVKMITLWRWSNSISQWPNYLVTFKYSSSTYILTHRMVVLGETWGTTFWVR